MEMEDLFIYLLERRKQQEILLGIQVDKVYLPVSWRILHFVQCWTMLDNVRFALSESVSSHED